jgi:hypothetical protein
MAFLRYKKRLGLYCVNGKTLARRDKIVKCCHSKRVTLTKKNHPISGVNGDPRVRVNWKRNVARIESE